MNRKRRSPIWTMSKEKFSQLVAESKTRGEILLRLGLSATGGGSSNILRSRIEEGGFDTSHFLKCYDKMCSERRRKMIPLSERMTEHFSGSRTNLKNRMIQEGVLKNGCSLCGCGTEWKGKPLVMALDHINGIKDDYRQENLRLLCPNCNSQTTTFSGRNNRGHIRTPEKFCARCNRKIFKYGNVSGFCKQCRPRERKVKDRPSVDELKKQVEDNGFQLPCPKGQGLSRGPRPTEDMQ